MPMVRVSHGGTFSNTTFTTGLGMNTVEFSLSAEKGNIIAVALHALSGQNYPYLTATGATILGTKYYATYASNQYETLVIMVATSTTITCTLQMSSNDSIDYIACVLS